MLSVECGKYTSHFAASKVASLFSHRTNIPRRAILLVAAVGFLTVTILPSASLHAELSDAQQRMANNLKTAVKNAGDLYKENKFSESAAEIKRAQRILDNLTKKATQDVLDEINSDYKRMQKAHKLLGEKGMKLDPMKSLPTPVADTAPAKKPKKNKEGEEEPVEEETSDEPEERPAANEKKSSDSETKRPAKRSGESEREERTADVSFTKQVAPVLVRHCGQCHIDASKGDISFANYQAMMDGPTIVVSDPDESSLVQEIESGKMPPKKGGKPVPAASLTLIRDWVKQGAKFDGEDPEAGLKGIVESSASAK